MLHDGSESPEVRDLALEVTSGDLDDAISAIFEFVRDNVTYTPDPEDRELFISPRIMVELIREGRAYGDCDDMSLFTASLLSSIGYRTKIIVLALEDDEYDHAIAAVWSEDLQDWIWLDTASKNPVGWRYGYHRKIDIE